MGGYGIIKYSRELHYITKLSDEKIQSYLNWLSMKNIDIIVMVFFEHTDRLIAIRKKYQKKYARRLIRLAAVIETIELYAHAETGITNFESVWFDETKIEYAKKNLDRFKQKDYKHE